MVDGDIPTSLIVSVLRGLLVCDTTGLHILFFHTFTEKKARKNPSKPEDCVNAYEICLFVSQVQVLLAHMVVRM